MGEGKRLDSDFHNVESCEDCKENNDDDEKCIRDVVRQPVHQLLQTRVDHPRHESGNKTERK